MSTMSAKIAVALVAATVLVGVGALVMVNLSPAVAELDGSAALPREVRMGVDDRAELPGDATLTYLGVIEDSRCPADAMCVWQGHVIVEFRLNDDRFRVVYEGESKRVIVADFEVEVHDVQPYPLASQPYDPADSEVTVTVRTAPVQ